MDMTTHSAIAGRLEEIKSGGWLSDYLVAWHGPSGELSPNVTVWRAADRSEGEVLRRLSGALAGLVATSDIVIAGI